MFCRFAEWHFLVDFRLGVFSRIGNAAFVRQTRIALPLAVGDAEQLR
jgi:hypothetical protein